MRIILSILLAAAVVMTSTGATAQDACVFNYPVGDARTGAPLSNNHPVNGTNLPDFGRHLGADFWSAGGCADLNQPVYAVAGGEVVEVIDALGSYLDVVVIRHDVADIGNVYSMYGHIARDSGLAEGQIVTRRQQIGVIDDVLAYFSPCHLHFELLNESAFLNGPFCNGCANAGYSVSPGYDRQLGVAEGMHPATGDRYIEVLNDGIAENRWFFVNDFIDSRLDAVCGTPDFEVSSSSYPARIFRDAPTATVELTLRNSGTLSWSIDSFRIATAENNALLLRASEGYCNSPTDCRVFLSRDVEPGGDIDISFDVEADQGLLDATATQERIALEWTMIQEGVAFFGPTERVEVELCEKSGVERCDGVGPVIDDPPQSGDGGSGGSDAGFSPNPMVDGGGFTSPSTGEGGGENPNVVHADGACCATLTGRPDRRPLWLVALVGLALSLRRSRPSRKQP